ncbi:WD40 domain-containing protein [Egbenema bharatensis]|uniref:WD40 domain-containing protein n=1 Tax=Egbenema bharatensis TaxID=3463334 RepID=UPI003A85766A
MTTIKASPQGIAQIKQARKQKGWAVNDFRWLEAASEILGTCWAQEGVLAVGVSEGTWKRFLAGKVPINAEAFKAYCQVLGLDWETIAAGEPANPNPPAIAVPEKHFSHPPDAPASLVTDWGEAPDVAIFYGRQTELETLNQWVVQERCRLVTVLGMGGMGKTSLVVKLAHSIHSVPPSPFQFILWRSLRNSLPIEELLTDLIQCLSQQQETHLAPHLSGQLSQLLTYLRSSRCLLILDNAESILQGGDRTGRYRPGYEGYGQLLRCVAETTHQSCLILTSREKPYGLSAFEGESLPVRSLQLSGLPDRDGRQLFGVKGSFTATDAEWQMLVSRYAGNPLALKIVASSIHDYFDGNVSYFLETTQRSAFLFDDIRDLLHQQFERLTELERSMMYWLAINREPSSLQELQSDFVISIPMREFLESLNSLQRRSFIEKTHIRFTQQPVVMEYVIDQLVERVCEELVRGAMAGYHSSNNDSPAVNRSATMLFQSHALIKAQSKDYVRETQSGLILQPLIDCLIAELGSTDAIADCLSQLLAHLRGKLPKETGYAAGNALNLLHHAGVDLAGFDGSDLTVWQAYLQGVALHDVNFTGSDLSRCVFTETLGNVLWADFSPDGQRLATGGTDCEVRVWEVRSGNLLRICHGHANWVRFLVFSPNGQSLASCGADRTVKLWTDDGVCIKTLLGHEHEVFTVAFSPDGTLLASGSGDRTVKLWDVRNGDCLRTLTGHGDWVRSVAFSPDGKILASGAADCTIQLWNVQTGTCLGTLSDHTDCVRSIVFNPQGTSLLSASSDRTIKLWDYQTGECLRTYTGHQGSIYAIALSSDGALIFSGSGDRTVKLWDYYSDTCIKTLYGQTNEVCSVAVNTDQQTIASVSLDQTLRLWDYQSGQCLRTWYGHTDWALPVAFGPDGQLLASGSNDQTVRLWDWRSGEYLNTLRGHTDFIYSVVFSPTGQVVASGSTDCSIRLWQTQTGECFQVLQGHTDWVNVVAFHPNGEQLISGSADGTARLWDIQTGQCLKTFRGHTEKLLGTAFSPDGQQLVSCSADQTIKFWDRDTGHCIKELRGHQSRVWRIVFHPDGERLASCSTDTTIKLWDIATGHCLQTLMGHTNWVFAIAFSPDGKLLASASHDQTVRVWDVQSGACLHVCAGHQHLVSSIAFNADGQTIASGSQDQTVRLWNAQTGDCKGVLIARRLYEGLRLTGVKGLTEATIATLQMLGAIV